MRELKGKKLEIAIKISAGYYYALGTMNFLKSSVVPEPSIIDIYENINDLLNKNIDRYDLLIIDYNDYKKIENTPSLYSLLPKDARLMILLTSIDPCKFNPEDYLYKGIRGILPLCIDQDTFSKFISIILNEEGQNKIDFLLSNARKQYDRTSRKIINKSVWVEARVKLFDSNYKKIIAI